ncbi:hypothetical protein DVV14_00005 [Vibrio coralliilyticus]|nr:hypothetical protein DVV14_00005 [Vibrio coralliilyticus]
MILASEDESERIATGSCSNLDGKVPSRAKGFNAKAPEPSCGTFESCLFCDYFAIHEDFEDIHKLLSLKEALNATSMIRMIQSIMKLLSSQHYFELTKFWILQAIIIMGLEKL